jgi:hypothetical protein
MIDLATAAAFQDTLLDLVYRNVSYTPGATVYVALFTALSDDGGTVTEASGFDYARTAVTFGAASGRAASNSGAVTFPDANGGAWGTITHVGIYDASTSGNLMFYGELDAPIVVNDAETFSIGTGDMTLTLGGALSDAIANALIDRVLRNQSWTALSSLYLTAFTAYTNDSTYTEATGGDWARQSAAYDAASGGATANTSTIVFPTATADIGTLTHLALFSASTSGTLVARGALDASKTVATGKIFKVLAGAHDLTWS